VPIRVEIENGSSRDRSWRFSFFSQYYYRSRQSIRYDWSARVEARGLGVFEVMVPVVTLPHGAHGSLTGTVQGYGVQRGHVSYAHGRAYGGHAKLPFVLMSTSLGTPIWSLLEEHCKETRREVSGSLFDASAAWIPGDWRAYTGVGSLWLSDVDWGRLPAAGRAAMLRWVAHGGSLVYCASGNAAARLAQAGFPGAGRNLAHGLGRIIPYDIQGSQLDVARLADAIVEHGEEPSEALQGGYGPDWQLAAALGDAKVNAPVLIVALVVFAVLIGPVNLLVFAGPRRRHRLFVTTPLLSLATAVGMGGVILLNDGLGGHGQRVALNLLLPEQREVVLVQEQASLTGVLLGQGFPLDADAFISSLRLDRSHQPRPSAFTLAPEAGSGAWFRSRSRQAQYLSSIRPSRARVDVILPESPSSVPVLLSTVEDRLRDVFYIDPSGTFWRVEELQVGRRTPMVESSREAYDRVWREGHLGRSGLHARGRLDRLSGRLNHVYAVADQAAPERFLSTHAAIDWSGTLLYAGPCARVGEPNP
jgi:hypothetical protein